MTKGLEVCYDVYASFNMAVELDKRHATCLMHIATVGTDELYAWLQTD